MTDNDELRRRAAGDLALAGQLLEIECAIYGGGATDADWHAFVGDLTAEQQKGAERALQAMWSLAAADLQPTAEAANIAVKVRLDSKSLRQWSVGIAYLRNFNRAEAMKLATAAAERMQTDDESPS